MSFVLAVLNWISGGLADKLLSAWQAKLVADGDANKLISKERSQELELEAQGQRVARDIRLATSAYIEMRVITVLFALPFLLHIWLVALDTCFALGWRIAKFPSPMDAWEQAVVLSFFGITAVGLGARALAGAIAYRK